MKYEKALKRWVAKERRRVKDYLVRQGIKNPNVGKWPAFEASPYFAIWAIESKKAPGQIGWWAFSGDCPTDYISAAGKCHPRNALKILLKEWKRHVSYLKKGRQPPNAIFGNSNNLSEVGEQLEKRVAILSGWIKDDSLWEDR